MTSIRSRVMWASMAFNTATGNAPRGSARLPRGFTLIELLVVLTIVALLLTIAAPEFLANVSRAKEAVLKEDLFTLRDAIDKYYADKGAYPATLDDLVTEKYLHRIPVDPMTDSAATWTIISPNQAESAGVIDIHSGAPGPARDGSRLETW
jgi:general secretion pathway protein G